MEVRLADSSYKESDSLEQHLYLYAGPSSLQWLIISNGETKFLGAKAWNGSGNVDAVHSLIQEEEVFGFQYASVHILLSASRLSLVPKDLYRAGEGQDFFEIADQVGIEEELHRSEHSPSPYEVLFPINRGYHLAWKLAFPHARIRFLHEELVEKIGLGSSIWLEDNRLVFFHQNDGGIQCLQVKPIESLADFDYQLALLIQAFPSINLNELPLYRCGSHEFSLIKENETKSLSWKSYPVNYRISPKHLSFFSRGEFQALSLLACE